MDGEDMDKQFELQIDGWLRNEETDLLDLPKVTLPPIRIVKCWVEEWEEEAVMHRGNQLSEARFTKKYSGLHFLDPDYGELHVIQDHMRYINRKGWSVTSILASYFRGISAEFPWKWQFPLIFGWKRRKGGNSW